jgi:hypothetical protein
MNVGLTLRGRFYYIFVILSGVGTHLSSSAVLMSQDGLVIRIPGYRSRGSGFVSRRYQIFGELVSLERGPLSLVSTIEELLGRKE